VSYQSAPFYWLTCDAPGCQERCPAHDDEYVAYADTSGALDAALDSDWKATGNAVHYCHEHARFVCDECSIYDPTEHPGDRDYLCVSCARNAEREDTQ
jgi:hypothetical protein